MVQIAESLGAARKAGAVADLCGGRFLRTRMQKSSFPLFFLRITKTIHRL